MSENIAQTVQKVIQDLVAPDVRELKTLVVALQKQMDQRFEQMDERFDMQNQKSDAQFKAQSEKVDSQFKAQSEKSDAQFKALMAAFGEFKAQSELATIRVISQLSERVAVLESQRH